MKTQTKQFTRRKENFTCVECGKSTQGTGYTDHCPACLTSLHVDIFPGDRQADCGGIMKPLAYNPTKNTLYYRCEKCGEYYHVKSAEDDNRELLLQLSAQPIPAEVE